MSLDFSWRIRFCAEVPKDTLKNLAPVVVKDDVVLDDYGTGSAVSNARMELNISQKALAIELGISQSYLCDLEAGHRGWTLAFFNRTKTAMEKLL